MFIKNTINYIKHRKVINQILKEEDLLNNLSKLFHANFKQDWIGRIYAVLNPITQSDPNERIFEYDIEGTNLNSFVEKWTMERMVAADTFVKNHELFDILIYEIKKLDDNFNFLFVLTPIAWVDFWNSTKNVLILLGALIFLGISLLIIF